PAVLDAVEKAIPERSAEVAAADTTVARLAAAYAPSAIETIDDNTTQARKLIALATEALETGRAGFAAGKVGEAAVAARTAQAALDQAPTLGTAIDEAAAALEQAARNLAAEITESEQDVVEARAANSATLEPSIAQVTAAIEFARANGSRDPLSSLTRLDQQS